MRFRLLRFVRRREAATAVEYAVLLGLIFMTAFAAVVLFGQATSKSFQNSSDSLSNASSGP
ncbi:MAG: Flp family type IVb pilin [Pirellulales bacterium]